jgi:riboflavin kinase/FMN adenylyltransferase
VYVVRVHGLTGQALPGIASLGVRPTVIDQGRLLLEVHLLDQRLDAYGKLARIEFLEFVRDEEKFPDLITMIAAIDNDAQRARDYFASNGL